MCGTYSGTIEAETVLARFKARGCIGYKVVRVRANGSFEAPYQHKPYKKVQTTRNSEGFHAWVRRADAVVDRDSWGSNVHTRIVKVKQSDRLTVGTASPDWGQDATYIASSIIEFLEWPIRSKRKAVKWLLTASCAFTILLSCQSPDWPNATRFNDHCNQAHA